MSYGRGRISYIHQEIPELSGGFVERGNVRVGSAKAANERRVIEVALGAMKLAKRLGIAPPAKSVAGGLTYEDGNDTLLFDAPLTSATVNRPFWYLRGWKQFGSCIKGFNSLGLMSDQIMRESARIRALSLDAVNALKLQFLGSRRGPNGPAFNEAELKRADEGQLLGIDIFDLAIWSCFAARTIVCSTSSNMGVSTHQALRMMQATQLTFLGKSFLLLNRDEGALVIWCPDERADFMNEEKTHLLRSLEKDQPQITRLRTYINRQQRDPGALGDALRVGGYFFPTNPQSKEEVQNLLFVALNELSKEKGIELEELVPSDPCVRATLESLGCEIKGSTVIVHEGIEGGIYGLMLPYIILLNEHLSFKLGNTVSVWNQASIGAALAAAVLADKILRHPEALPDNLRGEFNSLFPTLSKFLDSHRLGSSLKTRIHGVFDIANLQSLAQLLGVVVENHLSGRGTAYVGLGSSSYSNGNRCFEILRDSFENKGAFRGKSGFHPATHTLNPFAQALIFGEDLYRILKRGPRLNSPVDSVTLKTCMRHVRKPEPAGAAGLAGYLLTRLDSHTLSIVEIAYALKLVGFSRPTFLGFSGHTPDLAGSGSFVQLASEEGPAMGSLASQMLILLDWNLKDLERASSAEKARSRLRYWNSPLDDLDFEAQDGPTCMYLTGDNTKQPSESLVRVLAQECARNLEAIDRFLSHADSQQRQRRNTSPSAAAFLAFYKVSKNFSSLGAKLEAMGRRMVQRTLSRDEEGAISETRDQRTPQNSG